MNNEYRNITNVPLDRIVAIEQAPVEYVATDIDFEEYFDDIKEKYEAEIEAFEAGSNSSYPAAIGVDNFKFLYYGSTNEDEIYNYYKAQLVWESKLADYPENFFEIVEKFGKNYYNNYFDLSVKHVLFFVDYDMDGTPDNPTKFLNKLSAEKQNEFKNALVALMNAYLSEVHYLVEEKEYASLVEALTFVEKEIEKRIVGLGFPEEKLKNNKRISKKDEKSIDKLFIIMYYDKGLEERHKYAIVA